MCHHHFLPDEFESFYLLQYETALEPVLPWGYEQGKDGILNSGAGLPSAGVKMSGGT